MLGAYQNPPFLVPSFRSIFDLQKHALFNICFFNLAAALFMLGLAASNSLEFRAIPMQ